MTRQGRDPLPYLYNRRELEDFFNDNVSIQSLRGVLNTLVAQLFAQLFAASTAKDELSPKRPELVRISVESYPDKCVLLSVLTASPTREPVKVTKQQVDHGRMERVRQTVQKHLRSPTLRPGTLCRLVGMSRSDLYRLFRQTRGVARYIMSARLLEAYAVLSNPDNTSSITAIAEELCFAETSTFSRAFKREFGQRATDVRARALAQLDPRQARKIDLSSDARSPSAAIRHHRSAAPPNTGPWIEARRC